MSARRAAVSRKTLETAIEVELRLDGTGRAEVATGIGFLDHMLGALAKHARFDLTLKCEATSRSTITTPSRTAALALGQALDQALGERRGIARFGSAYAPLDEALARAVVDLSGRPCAVVELGLARETLGALACENVAHFFLARDRRAHGAARRRAARRQRPPPRRGVQGRGAGAAPGGARRWPRSGAEHEGGAVSADVVVVPTGTANLASVRGARCASARARASPRMRR